MNKKSLVGMLAAGSLLLAGCGSGGDSSGDTSNDDSKVEVVTWWAQGSEKAGLEALQKVFKKQHPDTKFVNSSISGGGGSQAKQKLQADLDAQNPPDTFQAHAGAELTDYINAGQIKDLSDLYEKWDLKKAFPDSLMKRLTVNDKVYSVPSNIHRANVVWANPKVMKSAGVDPKDPPTDIDSWISDMKKIKSNGKIPVAVGTDWTQTELLETILISNLGADGYSGLFTGDTDWSSKKVTKSVDQFGTIMKMTNKDRAGIDWEPAMQKVVDGKAAYSVMGDWALETFNSQDLKAGKDYVEFPVPGNKGVFDFLADSFTLPVGADHAGGAKNWLKTISSKKGQAEFSKAKGSIPARTDIDKSQFGPYQQSAMKSFQDDTIVSSIAHGAAVPVSVLTAINKAVSKFTQGASDEDQLQQGLVDAAKKIPEE